MKYIITAFAAALSAGLASAGSFTIAFEVEGEQVASWTYDDNGTATSSTGDVVTYAFDAASNTFTATAASGEKLSATFDDFEKTVGHEMAFEAGDGTIGTATIIDVNTDD